MRILTWNCNGAFRKKYDLIASLGADIVVVQECEDPSKVGGGYAAWANNHLWVGKNKNSGLGVFASKQIALKKLDWKDDNLELFLPCQINEEFNLLAVWTKQSSSRRRRYIGQLWHYIEQNKRMMAAQALLICGDFNSNSIWDMKHVGCDHTSVVRELSAIELVSLYHLRFGEEQGKESTATFYLHRSREKSYHIDYVFASRKLVGETGDVVIGDSEYWLTYSDHIPVIFDINV